MIRNFSHNRNSYPLACCYASFIAAIAISIDIHADIELKPSVRCVSEHITQCIGNKICCGTSNIESKAIKPGIVLVDMV
jgi:hypothetical protein